MSYIHECALCRSHATVEYHSTYKGHPIEVGTSWITRSKCYHSDSLGAATLAGIKRRISEFEMAATAVPSYIQGQHVKLLDTHPGDGGWSTAYVESVHGSTYGVRVQGHTRYFVTADRLAPME
jgi:hypothetical protein